MNLNNAVKMRYNETRERMHGRKLEVALKI